jgi:polysaccharide deacetylase family protein (PEP-CTERM system associated)
VLQDQSGQPVVGYRAASFSIGARNMWALDVLAEAGFLYDSSIFPVVHDRYGVPGAPRQIHRLTTPAGGQLVEIPPSTLSLGPLTLPVAGGGYLRLTPLAVTRRIVAHLNRRERIPAIVYVHPWEIDPPQPRIRGRLSNRFRHYHGLSRTETKLRALLSEFRFGTLDAVIGEAGFGIRQPRLVTPASRPS